MGLSLDHYLSTFTRTSWDWTREQPLVKDEKKRLVNLDEVTEDLCRVWRCGENLSSADSLALCGDRFLLIEYKNQALSHIDGRVIRKKAFDSLSVLLFLEGMGKVSLSTLRERGVFILVYRENDIPSFSLYRKKILGLSGKEEDALPFGLSPYRSFYREIVVMTREEFLASPWFSGIEDFSI